MITLALAALLLAPRAQADELQLELLLVGPSGEHRHSVTVDDPKPGRQPGLVLRGEGGDGVRVDLDVALLDKTEPEQTQQVMISAWIWTLGAPEEDVQVGTLVSQPRIITTIDQPATITQGERDADGKLLSGVHLELVYRSE